MKISFVSSHAISKALNYQMMRLQGDMMNAQKEMSSGKYADVGLVLGARTGQAVALNRDIDRLKALGDSNGLVSTRLDTIQDAMTRLTQEAEAFLSALTVGGGGDTERQVLQATGKNTLETLTSVLNTSLKGEYIFAGVNTDIKPINDYEEAGSPNKAAFDTAFTTFFGFPQSDPAVANISATDMTDFLDNVVQPMFMGTDWQANWSNATDEPVTSRITLNEMAETSVSANSEGIRKLAMTTSIISDLLQAPLNENARNALIDQSRVLVGEAIADVQNVQAKVGLVQNRVVSANERLSMQVEIMTKNLDDMQGVDPYEAATRVNDLLTQIETSYALTSRIQQLSLLKYL
jgi:flagellar hook-associated protein 3 FlgL